MYAHKHPLCDKSFTPSSSPLAQPKTTDKRFFLNGCRLTTPQAKLEEKKAEKETKRQWRRVEHALLLRCSAGAMIILGSDKYLESEFEQLISTKSNKNKNNAQKGKRPIMPSFKALSETCTKDNWQKLMARRRQQRQTTDRQNDSWNKKKERQLECHTQMQHSLTYTHTRTRARCSPLCTYIFICTLRFAHTFTYTYTHTYAGSIYYFFAFTTAAADTDTANMSNNKHADEVAAAAAAAVCRPECERESVMTPRQIQRRRFLRAHLSRLGVSETTLCSQSILRR